MIKMKKWLHLVSSNNLLRSIFLTQFLLSLGWYISTPFMAVYLTTNLQATPYQAGLFVGLGMLSYSLFSPFLGRLIDLRYEKTLTICSSTVLIFSFLSFYFIKHLTLFYIASILVGIGRAGFSTLINWSISNTVPYQNKNLAFSLRYIILNIGSVIGPLVSSFFIKDISLMFLVSLLFYLFSAISVIPCTNLKQISIISNPEKETKKSNQTQKLFFLILGLILFDICFSQMTVLFPLSIKHINNNWQSIYAVMFALNAILVIFAQLPITRLTNILGNMRSIYLGTLLLTGSFLIFSISSTSFEFYISIILFTLAELTIVPLTYLWIDNLAPSDKKGAYFGIYNLSLIGSAIGPIIGGGGAQYFGFHLFYLILAAIPIIMSICFIVSVKENFHQMNEESLGKSININT